MKKLKGHQLRGLIYNRSRAVYAHIIVKPKGVLMVVGPNHHGFRGQVEATLGVFVPTFSSYLVRYKPDPKGNLAVADEKCVKRYGRAHKYRLAVCWLPSSWPAGLRLTRSVKVLDGLSVKSDENF